MPKLKDPVELSAKSNYAGAVPSDSDEGISLFLPDVSELGKLPESGEITFKYCRKSLNLSEDNLSAQLVLCSITAVKAAPDAVEEKLPDTMDALFEEAQKAEARGDDDEVETGEGESI